MSENDKRDYNTYISKLIFNDNEELNVNQNDIVVFVGPNNAGKSQSLKDIYELCDSKKPSTVISDIEIYKPTDSLIDYVTSISNVQDHGNYKTYQGLNYSFNSINDRDNHFGNAQNIFVSYLNTETRLSICKPPQNINRNAPKTHPIHNVAFNQHYRMKISDYFNKAFATNIIPNTQYGATIPLCMGESISINKENESDFLVQMENYADILEQYPQIHNQGDGIRSFTGILLNLIIEHHKIFLIDEPESFLHPPQARIMGHTIGSLLSDKQQAFISTHSPEILKGLLETCPNRIKIVRITRNDNTNNFSILNKDEFNLLWKDPLLRHSEIMSSIFHKNVVLCESDSDCRLYSIIDSYIKETKNSFSETLFIHCGGKHRMGKVVSALKSLNIPVWIIPDIDILNDPSVLKGLIESAGGDWNNFESKTKLLSANLTTPNSTINRQEYKQCVLDILNQSSDGKLTPAEIKQLKDLLKTETKWSIVKHGGKNSIPPGDAYNAFEYLDKELKKLKIFIVPVGELECFIKNVAGAHGPEWVNKVLEQYPDFSDAVYKDIIDFVKSWNI